MQRPRASNIAMTTIVHLARDDPRAVHCSAFFRLDPTGDYQGLSWLHMAIGKGHKHVVKCIIWYYERIGKSVDQKDLVGHTPLFQVLTSAIENKQDLLEMAKDLISASADPLAATQYGETSFHYAQRHDMKVNVFLCAHSIEIHR